MEQPEVAPAEAPPVQPAADAPARRERWAFVGLALVLAAFATFVKVYFVAAIVGPDDNGYFAQGSLIARTGQTWFTPESDAQYIGFHWLVTPGGTYFARYPPGMPLAIAAVYALLGHRLAVLVVPAMAVLALLGTFSLARRLTTPGWGLASAALLAVNPIFLDHALTGDSHVFTAATLVWGVALLARWHDTGRRRDAFVAGLVLGCIPTVRYPDAVVAVGVVAFFLASYRRFPGIHRHYAAAVLGAAIPVGLLLVRNQLAFGAFWRTAYVLTAEQSGFSVAYFKEHFSTYLKHLSGDGLRAAFGLGVLGAVAMVSERRARAMGLLVLLATSSMMLLYMAYYWTGGMAGTMRFMLPTFPLYLVAAAWALHAATAQASVVSQATAASLLIGLQLAVSGAGSLRLAEQQRHQKRPLAWVTDELERVARPGDIVVAEGELIAHLDYVRQWRLADEGLYRRGAAGPLGLHGRFSPRRDEAPDTPAGEQKLKAKLQDEKLGATSEERRARFLAALRAWAGGARVFLVTPARVLRFGVASTASPESLRVVARVAKPPPPGAPRLGVGPKESAPDSGDGDPLEAPPPPAGTAEAGNEDDFLIVEWVP